MTNTEKAVSEAAITRKMFQVDPAQVRQALLEAKVEIDKYEAASSQPPQSLLDSLFVSLVAAGTPWVPQRATRVLPDPLPTSSAIATRAANKIVALSKVPDERAEIGRQREVETQPSS